MRLSELPRGVWRVVTSDIFQDPDAADIWTFGLKSFNYLRGIALLLIALGLPIAGLGLLSWTLALSFGGGLALAICFAVATVMALPILFVFVGFLGLKSGALWKENHVPIFLRDDDHNLKSGWLAKWLAKWLNNRVFITLGFCFIELGLLAVVVLPFLMVSGVFSPAALLLFSFTGAGAMVAVTVTFAGMLLAIGVLFWLLSLPRVQDLIKQTFAEKKALLTVSILFTGGAVIAIPLACFMAGFISPGLGVVGTLLFFTVLALAAAPLVSFAVSRAFGAIAVFLIRGFAKLGELIFGSNDFYTAAKDAFDEVKDNGTSQSVAIENHCTTRGAKRLAWVMFGYHGLIAVTQGSEYQTELENPGFVDTYYRMQTVKDEFSLGDTVATKAMKVFETVVTGYSFTHPLHHAAFPQDGDDGADDSLLPHS